jgi:hypothetical protein
MGAEASLEGRAAEETGSVVSAGAGVDAGAFVAEDGALVDGALPALRAMAPGSEMSALVSGSACNAKDEKKISPPMPAATVLNFPPYKDVRKIITSSIRYVTKAGFT